MRSRVSFLYINMHDGLLTLVDDLNLSHTSSAFALDLRFGDGVGGKGGVKKWKSAYMWESCLLQFLHLTKWESYASTQSQLVKEDRQNTITREELGG